MPTSAGEASHAIAACWGVGTTIVNHAIVNQSRDSQSHLQHHGELGSNAQPDPARQCQHLGGTAAIVNHKIVNHSGGGGGVTAMATHTHAETRHIAM
jgi:hypothetical protein